MVVELIIELHFLAEQRTALVVDGIEAKTQSGSPDANWTKPYLPHLVWHRSRHGLSLCALWLNWGTQGTCLLVLLSAVSNDWEQRGSWEKAQDWKGRIERGKEIMGDWSTYWHWESYWHWKRMAALMYWYAIVNQKKGKMWKCVEGILTAWVLVWNNSTIYDYYIMDESIVSWSK